MFQEKDVNRILNSIYIRMRLLSTHKYYRELPSKNLFKETYLVSTVIKSEPINSVNVNEVEEYLTNKYGCIKILSIFTNEDNILTANFKVKRVFTPKQYHNELTSDSYGSMGFIHKAKMIPNSKDFRSNYEKYLNRRGSSKLWKITEKDKEYLLYVIHRFNSFIESGNLKELYENYLDYIELDIECKSLNEDSIIKLKELVDDCYNSLDNSIFNVVNYPLVNAPKFINFKIKPLTMKSAKKSFRIIKYLTHIRNENN